MKKTITLLAASFAIFSAEAQVTNGLVAKYSFNNGDATDEVGSNDGVVSGATLTTDRFGNIGMAYAFDGSTSHINCGSATAVENMTTAYSISAWFKKTTTNPFFEVIVAKWAFSGDSEHFFLATIDTSAAWASPVPSNAGTADTANFNLGEWNHVVFTWELAGTNKVYTNNVLTTNSPIGAQTVNIVTPVDMMIGAQAVGNRHFNGSIDDVRIYNRALTPAEVDSLYNEADPMVSGLVQSNDNQAVVQFFPNPTKGQISFSVPSNVRLMSLMGQVLVEQKNTTSLDLSQQPAGVYFLSFTDEKGRIIQQSKVVKN